MMFDFVQSLKNSANSVLNSKTRNIRYDKSPLRKL